MSLCLCLSQCYDVTYACISHSSSLNKPTVIALLQLPLVYNWQARFFFRLLHGSLDNLDCTTLPFTTIIHRFHNDYNEYCDLLMLLLPNTLS